MDTFTIASLPFEGMGWLISISLDVILMSSRLLSASRITGPTKHPQWTPKDPKGHPKGLQRTPKDNKGTNWTNKSTKENNGENLMKIKC